MEPGVSAAATVNVTDDMAAPLFLAVEVIAQLAGIAAATGQGGGGILAAIDKAEFRSFPLPGQALLVEVVILKAFGPLNLVEGKVTCGDSIIATATIAVRLGEVQ